MKILQINAVNGLRSTGRMCLQLAEYLNTHGHEGYVAYSWGTPYYRGYRIGSKVEVRLHSVCSRVLGMQGYFSTNGTKRLLDYLSALKPDLIHLHNLHSNYINFPLVMDYIAKKNIPTVLTLHDCWFFTGKCTHYTVDQCYKWQSTCGGCPRLRKDNVSWFLDRTLRMHSDKKRLFSKVQRLTVVGVSDWIASQAKQSFLSSATITRIHNWIDTAIFKPADATSRRRSLGLTDEFVILGVASEWSREKGIDKFIELSRFTRSTEAIVLVGAAGKHHIPKNIIQVGEIASARELAEYYAMADVLLNLSMEESFGKVSAEALACGTPVITLNSTANAELVGSNCGYVANKSDVEVLLQYVSRVKRNGKMHYSKHCVDFARKKFNMKDRLSDYLGIYQNTVDL